MKFINDYVIIMKYLRFFSTTICLLFILSSSSSSSIGRSLADAKSVDHKVSPLLLGLLNKAPRSSFYDYYYNNNYNYMINDLHAITTTASTTTTTTTSENIYRKKAPSLLSLAADNSNSNLNSEQIIIFNIGDYVQLENTSSSYVQLFDQSSINYCNFDANLLSSKRSNFQKPITPKPNFHVNTFLKGDSFNESSRINVRIQFRNRVANSSQLWYLIEAKSVCTDQVVGEWKLTREANTDTIFCFDRDDTVFGHKNANNDITTYDQIWLPKNTHESIYFVIAVFTDETYSVDVKPTYFVISSPVFKYKNPNHQNILSDNQMNILNPDCLQSFTTEKSYVIETETTPPLPEAPTETTATVPQSPSTKTTTTTITTSTTTTTTTTNPPTTTTTKTSSSIETESYYIETEASSKQTTSSTTTIPKKYITHKSRKKTTNSRINDSFKRITKPYNQTDILEAINNSSRSLIVDIVAKAPNCELINLDYVKFFNDVKQHLENVYKSVENFDRVIIKKIQSSSCLSLRKQRIKTSRANIKKRRSSAAVLVAQEPVNADLANSRIDVNSLLREEFDENFSEINVSIEHYVLFNTPIRNQTKVKTLNTLRDYIRTEKRLGDLEVFNTYVLDPTNGTHVHFENQCSMYDYYSVCQNHGVCILNDDMTPACSCKNYLVGDSNVWTGEFCEIRMMHRVEFEKFKMLLILSSLALFAIVSFICLIFYVFYKRKQQREISKRYPNRFLISGSSTSCISSSTLDQSTDDSDSNVNNNQIAKTAAVSKNSYLNDDSALFNSKQNELIIIKSQNLPINCLEDNNYILNQSDSTLIKNKLLASLPINENNNNSENLLLNSYYLGRITPPLQFANNGASSNDLRHCFSLRSTALTNQTSQNITTTSTASSSDIYSDLEEKRLIATKSKALVCYTDGSSTSYKYHNHQESIQQQQREDDLDTTNNMLTVRSSGTQNNNLIYNFRPNNNPAFQSTKILIERSQVYASDSPLRENQIVSPRLRANLKPLSQESSIIKSPPRNDHPLPLTNVQQQDSDDVIYEIANIEIGAKINSYDHSHTNYAYDFTTNNPIHYQQKQMLKMNNPSSVATVEVKEEALKKEIPVIKQQNNADQIATGTKSNIKELRSKVEDLLSKNFLSSKPQQQQQQQHQLNNNNNNKNSRHLPQSIEKPMIQNFKSMNLKVTVDQEHQSTPGKSNETSARCVMIDSLTMSVADQSLRDEDAWLPILNIAEEQLFCKILKYELEQAKDSEVCKI